MVKCENDGYLIVRNPIYARLFDAIWIKSTRPKRTLAHTRSYAIAASIFAVFRACAGLVYLILFVWPDQQGLAVRQQLEELQIAIVQSEIGEGVRIEFPEGADQELLDNVVPLLEALQENVVEIDLQESDAILDTPIDIHDISSLAQLKMLLTLDVGDTQVTDITPLEQLTASQTLILSGTQVTMEQFEASRKVWRSVASQYRLSLTRDGTLNR